MIFALPCAPSDGMEYVTLGSGEPSPSSPPPLTSGIVADAGCAAAEMLGVVAARGSVNIVSWATIAAMRKSEPARRRVVVRR
jgi:hypothetical protein